MGAENIYLRESSADSFARAVSYDPAALAAFAGSLAGRLTPCDGRPLRVLDIGTGPGSFILPFVAAFRRRGGPDYRLHCLDASPHMARKFDAARAAWGVPKYKVRYAVRDVERGLGSFYAAGGYGLVCATFMLHYVKDWPRLLDTLAGCLAERGLLVQAEVAGDFRNLDGLFDVKSPILFRQFWEHYFTERAGYSAWAPELSVSNVSAALAYLLRQQRLKLFREDVLQWATSVRWGELCEWIAAAPVSSLGVGLEAESRALLSARMREWLGQKGLPLSDTISLRWGVKLTCLTRE